MTQSQNSVVLDLLCSDLILFADKFVSTLIVWRGSNHCCVISFFSLLAPNSICGSVQFIPAVTWPELSAWWMRAAGQGRRTNSIMPPLISARSSTTAQLHRLLLHKVLDKSAPQSVLHKVCSTKCALQSVLHKVLDKKPNCSTTVVLPPVSIFAPHSVKPARDGWVVTEMRMGIENPCYRWQRVGVAQCCK